MSQPIDIQVDAPGQTVTIDHLKIVPSSAAVAAAATSTTNPAAVPNQAAGPSHVTALSQVPIPSQATTSSQMTTPSHVTTPGQVAALGMVEASGGIGVSSNMRPLIAPTLAPLAPVQAGLNQNNLELYKNVAKHLHYEHNLLLLHLNGLLHPSGNREAYIQIARQAATQMVENIQALLGVSEQKPADDPADGSCPALVKLIRRASEYIIFDVNLSPDAIITWTCSHKALDGDEKGLPWHEVVAREFEKSAELVAIDMPKVLEYERGFDHGSLRVRESNGEAVVYDHFSDTPDGWESTGYKIVLPKARLARILKGVAVQIRKAYA